MGFNINRRDFERQSANRYIAMLKERLSTTTCSVLKYAPHLDYQRNALILFCIENNLKYEWEGGVFTIYKSEQ